LATYTKSGGLRIATFTCATGITANLNWMQRGRQQWELDIEADLQSLGDGRKRVWSALKSRNAKRDLPVSIEVADPAEVPLRHPSKKRLGADT
jgi:hypothetical protein